MLNLVEWITENYNFVLAIAFVIEFLLRLIPSTKNISIVDFVKKIIDTLIPNIKVEKKHGSRGAILRRLRNFNTKKIYSEKVD